MFEAKSYQPPPVESDEMSFAIALFVAAARGRIAPPGMAGFAQERRSFSTEDPVLSGAKAVLQEGLARLPDEVSLVCAVSVLWHHYEQDARQQAMCSRLVAFHAMFAQRKGATTKPDMHEREAYLIEAALSPAIVKAVSTATVGEDGLFQEAEFESLVEGYSGWPEERATLPPYKPSRYRAAKLRVTDDVQQLSLQLFAFQSCVAADPAGATPHFRTLEQLCSRVAHISGTVTLHAMLSRAWREALPDFPWLKYTSPSNATLLKGLDAAQPAPALREVMRCEMEILGLLIQLLRSLLGDAVTVQLLRSLWPLADLGDDRRRSPRSPGIGAHHGLQPATRTQ
jgi:hypothetical protein